MDKTRTTFYSGTSHNKTGTNNNDERLKTLERERDLLNRQIVDLQISDSQNSVSQKKVDDDLLIQNLLKRKESFKFEERREEKENVLKGDDSEMRRCLENIKDLTRANRYLEEKLTKQQNLLLTNRTEKLLAEQKLVKFEKMKETITEEEKLLETRKEEFLGDLTRIGVDLTSTEEKTKNYSSAFDSLRIGRESLIKDIATLEEELSSKKRDLADVINKQLNLEREQSINSNEKDNLENLRKTKNHCYDIYTNKLRELKELKISTDTDIERYKEAIRNKENEISVLEVEKEKNEKMHFEFRSMKNDFFSKLDKADSNREDVYRGLLRDRDNLANMEQRASETVYKGRNVFY